MARTHCTLLPSLGRQTCAGTSWWIISLMSMLRMTQVSMALGQSPCRLELVAVMQAVSRRVRLSGHHQQKLTVCLQGRRHWRTQRVPATKTQQSSCWPLALKSAGPGPAERTPSTPPPPQVLADVEFAAFACGHALPGCHPLLAAEP